MCNNKLKSEDHKSQYLVRCHFILITWSIRFGIDTVVLLIKSRGKFKTVLLALVLNFSFHVPGFE